MTRTNTGLLGVIIAYLAMMVIIGIRYSRKNKDVSDFYLGGRKLGPLVTAMSAEASDMSSWLLMGLPGLAYISGIADPGWTAIGLAVGTYLNWLFIAKRLRRYSEKLGAITIPDFFSKRFHDKSRALLGISALIIVVFFVPYTASGFSACGKLFGILFNMPYVPAMIMSAVIIVAYTTLGGFLAASTTDLIQSIVMTIALVIVVFYGVSLAGGIDVVMENAKTLSGYLSMTHSHDPNGNTANPYTLLTICSTAAWGLGYFGMPHILLRFMGTKDEEKLKLSRRIATCWVIISMGIAIFIGIIGYSVSLKGHTEVFTDTVHSETIILQIAKLLSTHGFLAIILAGLILAGILACTMSTADSQLLAAASSVSENLVHDVFGIRLSKKTSMIVARMTVIIISVIAVIIALDQNSSVFNIVSFAWAGFGASFGPVMLFALFWKRTNRFGALAGMLTGGIMIFIWKYLVRPLGGILDIYELLPSFILACIAIILVSLITPAPEKEIIDEYDTI